MPPRPPFPRPSIRAIIPGGRIYHKFQFTIQFITVLTTQPIKIVICLAGEMINPGRRNSAQPAPDHSWGGAAPGGAIAFQNTVAQ